MKNRLLLRLFCCFIIPSLAYSEEDPGKETIKPLLYPKFSVGANYSVIRHLEAFNGGNFKRELPNSYGIDLHAEAGLIKYFNAGFTVSITAASPVKNSSNILRLGLFAKPYFPFGDRFAIFSRIILGPSVAIWHEGAAYGFLLDPSLDGAYDFAYTYGNASYFPLAVGLNGAASIGFEAFVTTRVAITGEFGIRSDMLWAKQWDLERGPTRGLSGQPSPSWFHYMIYEFPIMVGVNIVL